MPVARATRGISLVLSNQRRGRRRRRQLGVTLGALPEECVRTRYHRTMFFVPRRPSGLHFRDGRDRRFRQVPPAVAIHKTSQASARPRGAAEAQEPAGKSVARSSLVMFVGTFLSRILGMIRSPILLGAVVGITSPVSGAFDIANTIPNFLYMIVVGGLVNAVLVPAIVRATKNSLDGGAAFINKLLTMTIVVLGSVTLLLTLASPLIVKGFAATASADSYALTVAFAYWCLPQIFFYGLYTVLGQILNARENFGPYTWAPALNNVVAVIGLLVILAKWGRYDPTSPASVAEWLGVRAATLGGVSTLGIVVQALILLWPMKRLGIRFRFDFQWRNSGLGSAGRASLWVFLTMLASLIPTLALTNAAAGATHRAELQGILLQEVGGNAIYSTANMIYTIPSSLIVVSIATAMFTRMATHAADGNMDAMRRDLSTTIRVVSPLMMLCSVIMIVLAVPISRVLAMTIMPLEVVTLSRVLIAMCTGLVAIGAVTVLNRAYYAFEDTRSVFFLHLPFHIAAFAGFAAAGFLPPRLTVIGIGAVMSAVNFGTALVLALALRKKMGRIDGKRILAVHIKLAIISLLTGVVGYALVALFSIPFDLSANVIHAAIADVIVAPLLAALFLGLMRVFQMDEFYAIMGPAKRLLRKVVRK